MPRYFNNFQDHSDGQPSDEDTVIKTKKLTSADSIDLTTTSASGASGSRESKLLDEMLILRTNYNKSVYQLENLKIAFKSPQVENKRLNDELHPAIECSHVVGFIFNSGINQSFRALVSTGVDYTLYRSY